jgi:tetratricopeptide (TPR) repeat protein
LRGKSMTKPMILRAQAIACDLVEMAMGATERGYALLNLGRVLYFQKKYDEAHVTFLNALDYAKLLQEQYDDKQLLHLVTANLMLTYTIRREYSNVEDLLGVVEETFADDPEKLGMVQYTRMKVQEERGNLELARNHAYRSLEHFEQTHNNRQIGHALINVAHYEYTLGNYKEAAQVLSTAIDTVKPFEDILVLAVKEYVKSLMQLKDHQTAIQVIEEYSDLVKDYPDYWGRLQIMYTVAKDDPSYAESVIDNSNVSVKVRYFACKCLMEFYYCRGDAETLMRYYEKSRIFSSTKSEYLNGEGF